MVYVSSNTYQEEADICFLAFPRVLDSDCIQHGETLRDARLRQDKLALGDNRRSQILSSQKNGLDHAMSVGKNEHSLSRKQINSTDLYNTILTQIGRRFQVELRKQAADSTLRPQSSQSDRAQPPPLKPESSQS